MLSTAFWMQDDHRATTEAVGNALDSQPRQRNYCPSLFPAQWPLGRILGTTRRWLISGRFFTYKFGAHPPHASDTTESANCVTISPFPSAPVPCPSVRPLCCRAAFPSSRVARHAGASPNRTPVRIVALAVNPAIRQSGDRFGAAGIQIGRASCRERV